MMLTMTKRFALYSLYRIAGFQGSVFSTLLVQFYGSGHFEIDLDIILSSHSLVFFFFSKVQADISSTKPLNDTLRRQKD